MSVHTAEIFRTSLLPKHLSNCGIYFSLILIGTSGAISRNKSTIGMVRTKGAVLPPREMKCPKSRYIPAQRFPRECIFHFQPTGSAYSDIPSFEDLYNFLKFRHLRYIIAGRDFYSLLEKSDRTTSRVLDLFNWEEDPSNRYQMQRMLRRHSWKYRGEHGSQPFLDLEHECRERYAKLALRSIGLKLPAKMSKRRKHWSEKLQAFGLEVCQILRTA